MENKLFFLLNFIFCKEQSKLNLVIYSIIFKVKKIFYKGIFFKIVIFFVMGVKFKVKFMIKCVKEEKRLKYEYFFKMIKKGNESLNVKGLIK